MSKDFICKETLILQEKCVAFNNMLSSIKLLKEYWIMQFSYFLAAKLDLRQNFWFKTPQ